MTVDRKKIEIDHYDTEYRDSDTRMPENHAYNGKTLRPLIKRLYELLRKYAPNKIILDYCCGDGIHAVPLSTMGAQKIIAIDLSQESLKVAKKRFEGKNHQVEFIVMDAEALTLPNESVDVVFDGGAFSSLELKKALNEIHRVLKPGGILIGVETLGHNPLMNLNRRRNVKRGNRTEWAQNHIIKMSDFELMKHYFTPLHHEFWELTALVGHALKIRPLIWIGTLIDSFLLRLPFLKKLAFKTIFIYKKPCLKE